MKPGVMRVRSPVDEDTSQPRSLLQLHHLNVAVVSSETDPALLLRVQPRVFSGCSDQQNIYQTLRVDSQQDSVYHTINPASR